VVGAPKWTGGDAAASAASLLGSDATAPSSALLLPPNLAGGTKSSGAGRALVKLSSSDGTASYMENIRTVYLYTAASSERGEYPSSQAGANDLFSFTRDTHQWGGGD